MESASGRRTWMVVAGVAALALVAFVLVWFQPQALLFDREVSEELPGADTAGGGSGELVEVARGSFQGFTGKSGSGTALLLETADGSHVVRFEELATDNGPDLRVYLSAAPADGDESAHDQDFVDLGALTANRGDQNYTVPADVDVRRFDSVVIWCRRFSVGFAAAPLG